MASDQTVWNLMGKALWDPHPTETDLRARQLAAALGYPLEWRVVRTLETMTVPASEEKRTSTNNQILITPASNGTTQASAVESSFVAEATISLATAVEATTTSQETTTPGTAPMTIAESSTAVSEAATTPPTAVPEVVGATATSPPAKTQAASAEEKSTAEPVVAPAAAPAAASSSVAPESLNLDTNTKDVEKAPPPATTKQVTAIVDRIYAGKPGTGCDMWFHHPAAMQAAQTWLESNPEQGPTPFDFKGGHLLPRLARFDKGDKVQVLYEQEWWDARILRRREHAEGFRYQVQYAADTSKQSGVDETLIRLRPQEQPKEDAVAAALAMGLEQGWQAFCTGKHKWKVVAPDGTVYRSKRAALEAYAQQYGTETTSAEGEDPPWRTTGNDYLGRYIRWVAQHKVSARRTVSVEQVGEIMGWISETDVDKAGEPGFVSERTGKPARLFHVVFEDDPHHPYASFLVQAQDIEEYELLECLLAEEEYRPKKKARRR